MFGQISRLRLVAAGSVVLLILGCAQDETPLRTSDYASRDAYQYAYSFPQLDRNSLGDLSSRVISVAWVSDEGMNVPQQPLPVLYLLHDFGGDASYFLRYGMQSLMDEMYSEGEIGRMLVVTVDASNTFGGSFYRNSGTTGEYEDVLDELIRYTEAPTGASWRVYTQAGRAARAISGHGMGGYGAMRYALDHPDMFGAVSAMSAPLSLGDPGEGTGEGTGVWEAGTGLIDLVFAENGTGPDDPDLYAKLYAGAQNPMTSMYFAMAAAFSPHPLRHFDSTGHLIVCKYLSGCHLKDTIYPWDFFTPLSAGSLTIKFTGADSNGAGVDMLFDSLGNFSEDTWAQWRDSADCRNVFVQKSTATPSFFKDVKVYIEVGEDDELGYREQTEEFHQALVTAGVEHTYDLYQGSGGVSAGHAQLVAARLRKVLRFHSAQFDSLGGRPLAP